MQQHESRISSKRKDSGVSEEASEVTHPFRVLRRLWRWERTSTPMLLMAAAVGLVTGLLGTAFQAGTEQLTHWRRNSIHTFEANVGYGWLLAMLVSAGMVALAWWLVVRFAPETGGSGVPEIEGALEGERPVRWKRVIPVKFFAGLLALGSGMVLGREGPTIQLGGSAGKMLGDLCNATDTTRHTLIAAGAAAGLAAAFNAPLAGILFVIEEMRLQFRYRFISLQAVIVASVISTIVVRFFLGQAPVLHIETFPAPVLGTFLFFLIFGAMFGLIGFLFNNLLVLTLDLFKYLRGIIGIGLAITVGATIGLLDFFAPSTTGGGYEVIPEAMQGAYVLQTLAVLFLIRFILTLASYSTGTPGGIFAPMLALGTLFGMGYGMIAHELLPGEVHHPGVYAVAGMCALFAATVRAPLTGLVLAIEMTANYALILPLIVTCLAASVVAQGLGGQPIYSVLLHRTLRMEREAKLKMTP